MKNKSVCLLLLTIIISSCILVYKIETTPKYDPYIYNQIYKEYDNIISIGDSTLDKNPLSSTTVINKNSTGDTYSTVGVISIPKINISYPIINECTEDNLNIAPTKLLGPNINTMGNLVILGHNNLNKTFFSNLHKLENGDIVELTDTSGKKLTYTVYSKYEINQDDFSCLDQNTDGKIELTLITCVKYQKTKRLVVKCIAN